MKFNILESLKMIDNLPKGVSNYAIAIKVINKEKQILADEIDDNLLLYLDTCLRNYINIHNTDINTINNAIVELLTKFANTENAYEMTMKEFLNLK